MLRKYLDLRKRCALGLIFLGFVSSVSAGGVSKPPIKFPFYPAKVGEIYSFDVNIVEQLIYSIDVRFYITLPNKWSHFFDTDSPDEARQLHEILGGGKFVNHVWIELGVPATFRVRIIEKASGKIVLDESVNRPKTMPTYMGRYADLVNKNLPVGIYSIRIEYVEGAPELAPLHARILFARAHHGK